MVRLFSINYQCEILQEKGQPKAHFFWTALEFDTFLEKLPPCD